MRLRENATRRSLAWSLQILRRLYRHIQHAVIVCADATTPAGKQSHDTDARERWRKSRLLSIVLMGNIFLDVPTTLALYVLHQYAICCILVLFQTCMLVTLWLNKRGWFEWATTLYLVAYSSATLLSVENYAPGNIVGGITLAMPILLAGLFLPLWAPFVLAIFNCLLMTISFAGEIGIVDYSGICFIFGSVAVISAIFAHSTKAAIKQASHALELERHAAQLDAANTHLKTMVDHDALTGLHNKGACLTYLDTLAVPAQSTGAPIALIFADIDHFKQINDTWGHQVGDSVLAYVATCIQRQAQHAAMIARFGGEEFVIILRGHDQEQAYTIAERIRTTIAAVPIAIGQERTIQVTLSLGISLLAQDAATIEEALQHADMAMYHAKHMGRNHVYLYTQLDCAEAAA